MSSFLPIDLSKTGALISNATNLLPPTLSTQVGNKVVGQIGNSNLTDRIVALGGGGKASQVLGKIFKQESAFPYKKPVSFLLLDRNRRLAMPPDKNFAPGYFFKMRVNPSQFNVTPPPRTIVPTRTLGGWKLQHWYPEIGTIQAEGMIGNMLERFNRDLKDSNAFRSFKNLLNIYQNNGVNGGRPYQGTNQNRTSQQDAFTPTAQCIYDRVVYEGYFESFNYTEAEELPHSIRYSFTFKYLTADDIEDMPGLTRNRAIDASIYNALVPGAAVQNVLNGL